MGEIPPLRIGVVDYLNAYPLWAAMENHSGVKLLRGVPSFLAGELHAGRLDAALISSVEYLRHPQGFYYHDSLCIAATRESKSIRLFMPEVSKPFEAALQNVQTIFTDVSSRSSVAQLRVILNHLHVKPALVEVTGAADRIARLRQGEALLTIGDTALAHMAEPSYDLQQQYFALFQCGFVYALWVMREDKRNVLEPVLAAAHKEYSEDLPLYLDLAAKRFGFSPDFTQAYLMETIQHTFSPERKRDLDFFAERLKNMP
ncbi:menaquinone biosynthetic enzyme MqnA/MqnD family protein [Turneriella parva]|uniref:Chorismate dehydratase n=1 Tax=Turneriella parva (strain ATCC BAA-1111 / DSM 21527 / NCTC 11395 / H) TaxID=869212 RepID=I4B375_TURPD|nr:MqnA/MqnD/SBP family protein [Turneriella parva]AFM11732.1 protein of unknown function DUF178 [Turneriella parva DSM 21527]